MIVFGSHSQKGTKTDADGLVGNKCSQNLWVYTADCMPIFFADKRTRNVATLHCGRKGLEKKIIKNLVKIFDNLGTSRDNLLVAIGPAISKEHYLVDKITLKDFYRKAENKNITANLTKDEKDQRRRKTFVEGDLVTVIYPEEEGEYAGTWHARIISFKPKGPNQQEDGYFVEWLEKTPSGKDWGNTTVPAKWIQRDDVINRTLDILDKELTV